MNMKYTTKDIGCYFDGRFGFEFNANRILNMAIGHGYTPHYQAENGEDLDALVYEMDDAVHYLNDNTTTPPNTYWSWEDGDFGLWMYCEEHPDEAMNPDEPCPYCEDTEQEPFIMSDKSYIDTVLPAPKFNPKTGEFE